MISLANVIFGAAGNDTLAGGGGADTLTGGEGVDTFNFAAGDGHDTIVDLEAGETVYIADYSAVQSITQVGANVTVTLSATDRLPSSTPILGLFRALSNSPACQQRVTTPWWAQPETTSLTLFGQ